MTLFPNSVGILFTVFLAHGFKDPQGLQDHPGVTVVEKLNQRNPDGGYTFKYVLSDGTTREETGKVEKEGRSLNVNGLYTYIGFDGQLRTVQYAANEKGYQTKEKVGSEIPQLKPMPELTPIRVMRTAEVSKKRLEEIQKADDEILLVKKIQLIPGTAAARYQQFFEFSEEAIEMGNKAKLALEISKELLQSFNLSKEEVAQRLPVLNRSGHSLKLLADTCPSTVVCSPNVLESPYRTIGGSCNNVAHPHWGKENTAYQRRLAPKYENGLDIPRRLSVTGKFLPSPRLISSNYNPDKDAPHSSLTLMVMQWGQFLDHDITATAISQGSQGQGISCCTNAGKIRELTERHSECLPIEIPEDDPFYGRHGSRCIQFVRSQAAPRSDCTFGYREQLNGITSFIDASNVYGSNEGLLASLREHVGGRLLSQKAGSSPHGLLPANPNQCTDETKTKSCFKAGDSRVNEQLELAVLHTIWMREHNRVARELEKLNPTWPDETLFQEARRIIIAEMEHITYNEFLPIVLGPEFVTSMDLLPKPKGSGHTETYNPDLNPSITNEFAAAAYRFGHSLVQGTIKGFNSLGGETSKLSLDQIQLRPFELYDSFDSFVRGLTTQECQQADNFVSEALTKHLFKGGAPFGLDLMSLNIQRGRDHGLAPYTEWRDACGLSRPRSWEELVSQRIMKPEIVGMLKDIYASVEDIDLFVGGLGEALEQERVLGPVFQCIVGDVFTRLRRGDRHFYEEKSGGFNTFQLDQIRKVTLARVLCDNSDQVTQNQRNVFKHASTENPMLPCSSPEIPRMDLRFWSSFPPTEPEQDLRTKPAAADEIPTSSIGDHSKIILEN